jgi:hypothetical protein
MRAQGRSKQGITRLCLANRPKVGGTTADSRRLPDYGNNFLKFIISAFLEVRNKFRVTYAEIMNFKKLIP